MKNQLTGVFPAHAGMNRGGGNPANLRTCVPRTRGDEPEADI